MKIDFTIYWFEDDLTWVDANKVGIERVKDYIGGLGFNPSIRFFFDQEPITSHRYLKSPDFVYSKIDGYESHTLDAEGIDFNNADLVLMDFNLSDQVKGDAIIQHIRNNQRDFFTEILFYAEGQSQDDLRKAANRDGLYCAERDIVFEKLIKVIRTLVKKTQDLNNLRGLVMAETSEIDGIMKDVIRGIVHKHGLTHSEYRSACSQCGRGAESHFKDSKNKVVFQFPRYRADVNLLINELSTSVLYNAIRNYITGAGTIILQEYDIYQRDICRNILAHNPESTSNHLVMNILMAGGTLEAFDEQRFIEIRRNIQKYKDVFMRIKATI